MSCLSYLLMIWCGGHGILEYDHAFDDVCSRRTHLTYLPPSIGGILALENHVETNIKHGCHVYNSQKSYNGLYIRISRMKS
jgi:hypothetical protein